MMFKSTNLQTALGMGVVDASAAINTGTMNDKGLFWGNTSSKTVGVKAFGMENLWGNVFRRIAGWGYKGGKQYLKLTRGTKDETSATDYNTDGTGYLQVSATVDTNGYISVMQTQRYGRLPLTCLGSATTYEADQVLRGTNTSNYYYAQVGGYHSTDLGAGPFYVNLGVRTTSTQVYIGAALSCKPLATA